MTTPRIYLRIPLSPFSGYGADGIGIAKTLIESGAEVMVEPTIVQYPIPEVVNSHINREVKGPFDVSIVHVDPMILKASAELKENSTVVIGWTMWEYSNLSNLASALPAGAPSLDEYMRENLQHFDVLVAYDQNTKDSLAPYFDGPIVVVQGGFDPTMWPELVARDWSSKEFRFCQIGVLSERKDPFRSVEAFGLAKSMDPEFNRWARLSLKTTAPGLHSKMEEMFGEWDEELGRRVERDPETGEAYQSLRIFYDMWPTDLVLKFYLANHVLVAPSRGEGKNMPALEFMSTGGTVIATNWAGHTQWLSTDYAYPLDYTLEPSEPGSEAYNARASVQHLAELMLHTFHNREEVRHKGEVAAQTIPVMCSWPRVMERLFLRVGEAAGEGGQRMLAAVSGLDLFGRERR